jgi:S-adenosylmethionine hydrolase
LPNTRVKSARQGPAPIALLSDFGWSDHYAGVMKGVIASLAPLAPLIDITHGVAAQSVLAGALALRESWRFFPRRTVFLAVVDPGVGTARRAVAIETVAGARFVGPDNGVLWLAADQAKIRRAVELRAPRYRLANVSDTFHGRDVFAPAAAYLWRGVALRALGPEVTDLARLDLESPQERGRQLCGTVIYVDHFGNLISNIPRECFERFTARFPGSRVSIKIGARTRVELVRTYAHSATGAAMALFGSFELLEIAVRNGSAAQRLRAGTGTAVEVKIE